MAASLPLTAESIGIDRTRMRGTAIKQVRRLGALRADAAARRYITASMSSYRSNPCLT